jgi:hypothetical protein
MAENQSQAMFPLLYLEELRYYLTINLNLISKSFMSLYDALKMVPLDCLIFNFQRFMDRESSITEKENQF